MKTALKAAATALALTGVTLSALPAAALSCLRPDPVNLYKQAVDAQESFRIVHGTLTPLQKVRKQRPATDQGEKKPIRIRARLQGMQLGATGFSAPFDQEVDVMLVCFAAWCGQFPESGQMLMAVEQRGTRQVVESDPCSSKIYSKPTTAELRRVTTCHKGGRCQPLER